MCVCEKEVVCVHRSAECDTAGVHRHRRGRKAYGCHFSLKGVNFLEKGCFLSLVHGIVRLLCANTSECVPDTYSNPHACTSAHHTPHTTHHTPHTLAIHLYRHMLPMHLVNIHTAKVLLPNRAANTNGK